MKKLKEVRFVIKQGNRIDIVLRRQYDEKTIRRIEDHYSLNGLLTTVIAF